MRNYRINQDWLMLVGRILFSSTFLFSAIVIRQIFAFELTLFYKVGAGLASFAEIFIVIAVILELLGTFLILLGWHTRLGAAIIFLFTLVVIFAAHHFWTFPSSEVLTQLRFFMSDIALLGGCLYIIAFGAGKYSLDSFRRENEWFKI